MGQSSVNEFSVDLHYSLAARDEGFWGAVYRKAFPNLEAIELCDDLDLQRRGIDRFVYLSNGRVLTVDEKKRRHNYGDVLLEYLSNSSTGSPGWMEKDLAIDWLAYAFMSEQRVYMFNWQMLKRVWGHHKRDWIDAAKRNRDGFQIIAAKNPGYITYSIAVPLDLLLRKLSIATIIQLRG